MSDAADFRVEKVEKVSKSVQAFRRYVEHQAPGGVPTDRGYFESLMKLEKQPQQKVAQDPVETRPSLMDEVAKVNGNAQKVQKASSVDLINKTQDAIARIDELKAQLATPELELKAGVQKLMKNKLASINDNLKVAFSKAGLEYIPPERQFNTENPAMQFLDYLADGQNKLETVSTQVALLAEQGEEMTPPQLMTVQLKINYIQQELEFFSGLLNKVLESTKTVMNVQV